MGVYTTYPKDHRHHSLAGEETKDHRLSTPLKLGRLFGIVVRRGPLKCALAKKHGECYSPLYPGPEWATILAPSGRNEIHTN
jgi:hypothetical protein